MKKLFLLLALMCVVAIGCSKDEIDNGNEDKIEQPDENDGGNEDDIPEIIFFGLDKENVAIAPDGGSVDVIVYSNYKWEISGASDWCSPSVKKGNPNEDGQKVTFSADVAYDDREATFWFRCADEKIKLVVSQNLKAVIIPDSANIFNIPFEGGIAVISYKTSVDCEVIIPEDAQDWITVAPATRGLDTYNTTLNIAANNSREPRSSVVKVISQDHDELVEEYIIAQSQNSGYYLYYTSVDGEIVIPNNSSFDATIVSNTYEDGVGVIEFNAPITTIGKGAFAYCSSLTSVTVPKSVTTIGDNPFQVCNSLQKFNGKFASDDGRCLIIDSVLKSFAPAGLTEYSISESVTSIGVTAFLGCGSLANVTIGDSVTTIGADAFGYCSSLTSVTVPKSVTTIGYNPFRDCNSLQKFNGKFASEDGRCLIMDGVLKSFAPAGLTEYCIHDSVTMIGALAFHYCSSLTSVTIPDGVTAIGFAAFERCSSLKSVIIPDSITIIEDDSFFGCSSLTSVSIPDGVTAIGDFAFTNCDSLTTLTIPESVTSIGNWVFADCNSLTSVYCKPTTPPSSGSDIFNSNASGRKIYVPIQSVSEYMNANVWRDYADAIVGYNF